ncbi:mitochondrial fission ELM1 family protein [Phenylobacterium sp. J426]|uniref:mitochondrial fission ELM1 family protein n=1 Tax=Phenylobacterium sp. J426 TaxID=2898439 RepID=UPI0021512F04|nr:mitochondrial fission ELM1 family protein [Phenylobacterium sp. J426]MCR5872846.1 mitochondrial fission ELM1 family protein [Phenylobacterium sp. J426]
MGATSPPLTIWAVSDGRAGIEAQALGLAEAVARLRPAEISVKRIAWRWGLGRLPWRLIPPAALAERLPDTLPDIWIAAGRATLPLSTRLKGRTFVVQTQDPRAPLERFNLVVPPEHDRLAGANVFPILGAPNRLTPKRLADELAAFPDLSTLTAPRVAVIVGGKSKAHDLPRAHAAALADRIAAAVRAAGGSLMLSFTRRTPPAARAAMSARLGDLPGVIWDERPPNPYFAYLAAADVVLVTEDSTNLATDAAATGKPVYVLPMPGHSEKLTRFHADLRARGLARPFEDRLESWTSAPLAETDRAAGELIRRYDAAQAQRGRNSA